MEGTLQKGSEQNDVFDHQDGKVVTLTNNSGGIQGGLSNGEAIVMEAGFKPVATLIQNQPSIDTEGKPVDIMGKGTPRPLRITKGCTNCRSHDGISFGRSFITE